MQEQDYLINLWIGLKSVANNDEKNYKPIKFRVHEKIVAFIV